MIETDLLSQAHSLQKQFESETTPSARKARGQFFTPPSVASFMASLFTNISDNMRVLDPGAGAGILSVAFCERILKSKKLKTLFIELYETDSKVIDILSHNMKRCQKQLQKAGHKMSYKINEEDFILSNSHIQKQASLFDKKKDAAKFNFIIANPPYFKIAKDSEYAKIMNHVVHGQPNIYALFMALASDLLADNGEMVLITPRSFCNGLYFRSFRKWYLSHMSLEHIHIFESRSDNFHGDVLQENIITLSCRSAQQSAFVNLSSSHNKDIESTVNARRIPSHFVIDASNANVSINIPENHYDEDIIDVIGHLPNRFFETGLRISTGPVVSFRAKSYLLNEYDACKSTPLISVHNVHSFSTIWPIRKKNKPLAFLISETSRSLLIPNKNYVFVRRFTAKEEARRLVASQHIKTNIRHDHLALENHVNYIYHEDIELSEKHIFGIAAIFNSLLFDKYFRTQSGSTQVNATEIRNMKFPTLSTIENIGRQIIKYGTPSSLEVERIVSRELNIGKQLTEYLLENSNGKD